MIVVFQGGLGSGKTLVMSWLASAEAASGRRVAANYPLRCADQITRWSDLYEFTDGVWAWDEAHVDMDSREFSKNVEATVWFLQTRKLYLDILMTTQHFGQLDNRVRNVADFLIECRRVVNAGGSRASECMVIDLYSVQLKSRFTLSHSPDLYNLYDTFAKVRPLVR